MLTKIWSYKVVTIVSMLMSGCSTNSEIADAIQTQQKESHRSLLRFATMPLGAEVAGLFESDNGDVFLNVQHPFVSVAPNPQNNTLSGGRGLASIGVIENVTVPTMPFDFHEVGAPTSETQKGSIQLAFGEFNVLAMERDTFGGNIPFGLGVIPNFDGTVGLD